MKKTLFLIGLIVLVAISVSNMALAMSSKVTMILGEQKTISEKNIKRIAVGNPDIADVKVIGKNDQILITAMNPGRTNLIIWDNSSNESSILIEVIARDPKEIANEVATLLEGIEGITVKNVGMRTVIDGYVLKKEDLDKITKISKLYPQVSNLAIMSPAVLDIVTQYINKEFKNEGLDGLRAKRLANSIVIDGDVPNEKIKKQAEIIASAFGVKAINFVNVGVTIEQMIVVNVDFIEIKKGDLLNLGIQWTDSSGKLAGFSGSGSGGFGSGAAAFTGVYGFDYNVTLNALKGNSQARFLAQPRLLCRSGEKAEFLAGGETAIPIVTANTTSVEYKPYGILLNIQPVVDNKHNIATSIEVENSTIQVSGNGGLPNFSKSSVKTFINVKSGQTIVLSGLFSNDNAKAVSKVPGLGSIPILGELFKSRDFKNNQTELLIFVTPMVVKPNDPDQEKQISEMKGKYDETDVSELKLMD